jgi:hypothetical protein
MTTNAGAGEVIGDIGSVFRQLMTDPVGRIGAAFSSLSTNRAQLVGLALCVIFAIAMGLGLTLGRRAAIMSIFGASAFSYGDYGESGFTFFLKSVLQMLVMPAAMIGISFGLRRLGGSKHPVAHDAFIVGVALMPIAVCTLLAGLFGSLQLALLLVFLGLSFAILILYAGLTTICGLATRTASVAVPLIIVLGGWISQRLLAVFE